MAMVVIARRRGWSLVSINNQVRGMSELVTQIGKGRRALLVDTLSLVKRLEGQGVPSNNAEAITSVITEVLNDSLENVSQCFVSNEKMRMSEMVHDANLSKFKYEVKNSQEHHHSSLQREIEKFGAEIEKMRSEHRADNKLMRSELGADIEKVRSEVGVNIEKMQRELSVKIHDLISHLEACKYDVIKYYVGSLVSVVAVGLAGIKFLM